MASLAAVYGLNCGDAFDLLEAAMENDTEHAAHMQTSGDAEL
jgi:hypothetical protein